MSVVEANKSPLVPRGNWRGTAKLVAPLILALALTVTLYLGAIYWWYYEWTREGSYYAHGIFIPFFVGLMIYRDRERLRRLPIGRNWWGLLYLGFAIGLVVLAKRAQVTTSLSISFILFLIGAVNLLAGKAISRALLFPMLFLITMIPVVPDQLINPIAFPIQITSAKMAASICNLIGFPAVRSGTFIQMEHYLLNVELPCSGFKTLVGLMAFAAAFAWLVDGEKWKRWTIFASAAPLAIFVNGVRITFIALVGEVFGEKAAAGFHDWSGFIVLILGFTFLFNFAKLIKCVSFLGMPLMDPVEVSPEAEIVDAAFDESAAEETEKIAEQQKMDSLYGAVRTNTLGHLAHGVWPLLLILSLSCIATASINPPTVRIKPIGPSDIAASLPEQWGKSGEDVPIADIVKHATNPDAWLDRYYSRSGANYSRVNLLVSAGSGRRVFHDPHTCFLGNGYFLHDVGLEKIDTPVGPVTCQLSEVEDPEHNRSLMAFLYIVDAKQFQTTQGVNLALLYQTILGDAGRPSYFLRFRMMLPGTGPDRKEELRSFVRSVWQTIGPRVCDAAAKPK